MDTTLELTCDVPPEHPLHAMRSQQRAEQAYESRLDHVYRSRDNVFAWLMGAQAILAVVIALVYSPQAWSGKHSAVNAHVFYAVGFGALISGTCIALAILKPGRPVTRYAIAVGQMLWSAVFIHLTGGRIETHFHVFGSLAFIAFYRDLRLLLIATLVVCFEHSYRGFFWAESVYGITSPEWWRFLEHAFWVVFEDIVLIMGILQNQRELRSLAEKQTAMEDVQLSVERQVVERTRELKQSIEQRRAMELELQQAQKLEAVGSLASGIAHEINTPIQFVSDNIHFLRESLDTTFSLLVRYRDAHPEIATEEDDLDYLITNVPKALTSTEDGLQRVSTLVRSMKEFAHPDAKEKTKSDLNRALQTTIVMATNEYKYVADVTTNFGEIPHVACHVSQLNQVFLNLIVNASHAISDVVKDTEKRGHITITTRQDEDHVIVAIADTGTGIPKEVRTRVFDQFFTTKGIGKGTGQGLAIARNVVVDKHGGTLTFDTALGRGTTFYIRLPIEAETTAKAA